MDIIWKLIYVAISVFVFFIIPLAISIYECDPEWTCCEKLKNGFCFFACELVIVIGLFGITYLFLHKTNVPMTALQCEYNNDLSNSDEAIPPLADDLCTGKEVDIEITVNFFVYIIALISFVSYILFVIFGGMGIFAFPFELIYSFCTRPLRLNPNKLEELKKQIVVTAADLKDLAMQIKKLEEKGHHTKTILSAEKRHYNDLVKQLKVGVSVIDEQYQQIQLQDKTKHTSALGYLFQLIGGIIALILSILWILQILFYVIFTKDGQPLFSFLNTPLVSLTDHNFSFIAILIFTVFSFYLLLCTLKGNVKFGIRLMCLGQIHPLKKDGTYMNSILFNVMLIMFTSVSLIQFCVKAFGEYTSLTEADIILNTQIRYLRFYSLFYNHCIFEFAFLIIAAISFFYFIFKPSDASTMKRILYRKLENEKKLNAENNQHIEMVAKA